MSTEFTVYLSREAMPTPRAWAEAIIDSGFDAELDARFDVDKLSGFLPCRYDGADAGFEYESGPIELVDDLELPEDFDFSVTFTARSTPRELASSVACAAILCRISHGILVDTEADAAISADEAVAWAQERLEDIDL
jgi:hypothetical protein